MHVKHMHVKRAYALAKYCMTNSYYTNWHYVLTRLWMCCTPVIFLRIYLHFALLFSLNSFIYFSRTLFNLYLCTLSIWIKYNKNNNDVKLFKDSVCYIRVAQCCCVRSQNQLLEVDPKSANCVDLAGIVTEKRSGNNLQGNLLTSSLSWRSKVKERPNSPEFIDDADVPGLIWMWYEWVSASSGGETN